MEEVAVYFVGLPSPGQVRSIPSLISNTRSRADTSIPSAIKDRIKATLAEDVFSR